MGDSSAEPGNALIFDKWRKIGKRSKAVYCGLPNVWALVMALTCGSWIYGLNTAVLNTAGDPIAGEMKWCGNEGHTDCDKATWYKNGVSSMIFVGATIGALMSGWLVSRWSARTIFLLSVFVTILASIGIAFSHHFAAFMVTRFLIGLPTGVLSSVTPRFIASIAPSSQRGTLTTIHQFVIVIGQFIALLLGLVFRTPPTDEAAQATWKMPKLNKLWWRVMNLTPVVPSVIGLIVLYFVFRIELPSEYLEQNKVEDSVRLARFITGNRPEQPTGQATEKEDEYLRDLGISRTDQGVEVAEGEAAVFDPAAAAVVDGLEYCVARNQKIPQKAASKNTHSSPPVMATDMATGEPVALFKTKEADELMATDGEQRSVLSKKGYKYVLFIGVMVAMFQQITGINSFVSQSTRMFKDAGLAADKAIYASIAMAAVPVVSTFIPMKLMDKLGRRIIFIWGSALMCLATLPAAVLYYTPVADDYPDVVTYCALVGTFVFMFAFATSAGPLTWVYLVEVWPKDMASIGTSVCVAVNWFSAVVMVFLAGIISSKLAFLIFTICSAIYFLFCLFLVKETKGRAFGDSPYLD